MTRDEAVDRILEGLGFRSDLQAAARRRIREVQAQREQGQTLPWFLMKEDQALTLSAATNAVPLPDDFIRELDYPTIRTTNQGKLRFIEKKDFDRIVQATAGKPPQMPSVYALRADSLFFMPTPDVQYVFLWDYFAHDVVLEDNVNTPNKWLTHAPLVLVGAAGLSLARTLRNKLAIEEFTGILVEAEKRLMAETITRQEAARNRYLGQNR